MNRTGLSYHKGCLKHQPLPGKPEVPYRVLSTYEHFMDSGLLGRLKPLTPEPASEEDLQAVHTAELVGYVRDLSIKGYEEDAVINGDIYVGPQTYDSALLSAGGVCLAAESVCRGDVDNAFALVRPPGHHASRRFPAGFCFFNNTAIAVRRIQALYGLGRVAIFDWDAHCGHGTMDVFYEDPNVLTISVHQDPSDFYPGTGFVEQVGDGDGKGYCMNIPVPAGTANADYLHIIDDFVTPKLAQFQPEFIFVAAGQDSHLDDGMSGLRLTDDGYGAMTSRLMEAAEDLCKRRLVLTLEGGYNVATLPATNHRIVSTLLGEAECPAIEGDVMQSTKDVLVKLRDALRGTPMSDGASAPEEGA